MKRNAGVIAAIVGLLFAGGATAAHGLGSLPDLDVLEDEQCVTVTGLVEVDGLVAVSADGAGCADGR